VFFLYFHQIFRHNKGSKIISHSYAVSSINRLLPMEWGVFLFNLRRVVWLV
jgi:hypothetical protein